MARGRMLNKTICASLKFQTLPDDTCRLLATWTICHLDKTGVFYGDPAMVRSTIFPRRNDLTMDDIARYLDAIERVGLMTRFEAKGDIWQWWPGFTDNQVGLRPERETTDFPQSPDTAPDSCRPDADTAPDSCRPDTRLREVKRSESNGNEEKESEAVINSFQQATQTDDLTPGQITDLRNLTARWGCQLLQEVIHWAGRKGMTAGEALPAIITALPTWQPSAKAHAKAEDADPRRYTRGRYSAIIQS